MLQSGICPGSGSVSINITGPEAHLWEKHYWTKKQYMTSIVRLYWHSIVSIIEYICAGMVAYLY